MKLLKLIPAAAIVLSAFTTFEAKAAYPSSCTNSRNYSLISSAESCGDCKRKCKTKVLGICTKYVTVCTQNAEDCPEGS